MVYWDGPEAPIGQTLADPLGDVKGITFTVPITAALGSYQIAVDVTGTMGITTSFTVLD